MDPLVWGPHGWIFLHSITLAYPDCPNKADKEAIKTFFTHLGPILPCDKCRHNFDNHLKKYPLTEKILCSRESLVRWLIDIHNEVNKLNGKPTLSYEEVLTIFLNLYSKNSNFYKYTVWILLLLLCILLFVLLFFVIKNKIK